MVAPPVVDPTRFWTPEDLLHLPEDADWRRYEIVDGTLVVSPMPSVEHGFVMAALLRVLSEQLPSELREIHTLGVEIGRSYRVPDIVVVPYALRRRGGTNIEPDDVVLAVEVVSPGSVTTDRITKPAQYAAAGIGAYWRVETDPISLTAYELDGTIYRDTGTWGLGETARLTAPFVVEIEIDRLA